MEVNHFNTFPYGGAATAALRLHTQMRNSGIDSRFLFEESDRKFKSDLSIEMIEWAAERQSLDNPLAKFFDKRRIRRIHHQYDAHLARRNKQLELFSMPERTKRTRLDRSRTQGSILHLHWIAFMADFPSFFGSVPPNTPIVWTLHDMNPITGGCHYSDGCEKFIHGCGNCPQIVDQGRSDISAHGFRTKKKAYHRQNMTIVSPSLWLKRLAESSSVFPTATSFRHIKLGFDLSSLYPLDRILARNHLGINPEKVVVGFGAESVNNPRKGIDLLLAALANLPSKTEVECVVFGTGDIDSPGLDLPKINQFGFVSDPVQMAQFYSACDLVVVPSREDNQPQVGLEAMACGTPVIGFDVGGIAEYIKPGFTGWLAEPENSMDLSHQMHKLIVNLESRAAMSQNCRTMMEQEFDIVKQSEKYVGIYRELLGTSSKRAA